MDVAVIDWKDSKFEKDPVYEDLNAPQWIDLSNDDNPNPVDDEAWFCRPDCNHPKTVEDFFTPPSSNSKLQRSSGVSEILGSVDHRNKRDPAALKKRGGFPSNKDSKTTKYVQDDDENHNPNFSTPPPPPPMNKAKSLKQMIKSSSEKNHFEKNVKEEIQQQQPLKTTLSAHNLFAGRDIFNQVTDFCNELKRLAMMRRRTKDNGEKQEEMGGVFQRMPLLEMKKKYDEGTQNHNNVKDNKKLTNKKLNVESENTPVTLNMKNIRSKEEKRLLQIRTNPPSPQCFSAKRKATPPTAFGFKPQERGTLEEIEGISSSSSSKEVKGRTSQSQTSPLLKQNEAKGLDVFWIFKPCTLSR